MKSLPRGDRAVTSLLKAAMLRAEDLRARRADVEAERTSAETALEWLDQSVRTEELIAADRPHLGPALKNYLDAAEARRRALEARRDWLRAAAVEIETAMSEAFMEIRKLEFLLETRRASVAVDAAKSAERHADETAACRVRAATQ